MRNIFHNSTQAARWGQRLAALCTILAAGFSLSGCIGAAVVAGTGAGVMISQERSVGDGIDDMAMDLQIKDRMIQEGGSALSQVNVDINEGRVLLTGIVDTPEDRVTAARATWSHPRVKEVMNDIEISERSRWKRVPQDTWITTKLRTKFLFDTELRSFNYEIEVVNGTVYLLGIAQNQMELERATTHARTISGVKKVVSHVYLKEGRDRKAMLVGQR